MSSGAAQVLLRRRRLVFVPLDGAGGADSGAGPEPAADLGVTALEADLLDRGLLVGATLRHRLAGMSLPGLEILGSWLLESVDTDLGAASPHVPLFRGFPRSVPADTVEFYIRRVVALLLQYPDQPCVLCETANAPQAVDPCGHLVCGKCWDGADFSACPICHRRIDVNSPFLKLMPARAETARPGPSGGLPQRAAVLGAVDDLNAAVRGLLGDFLARQIPLTPSELDDVTILQAHLGHDDLSWLPAEIPVRETKATVLGAILADASAVDRLCELLPRYLDTATDVLRLLYVRMGGSADLTVQPPRRVSLPRRVRRAVLGLLEAMTFEYAAEDILRRGGQWKQMAELLHPFEEAKQYPQTALVFAILRGTPVQSDDRFGAIVLAVAAEHPESVRPAPGSRLAFASWGAHVELALREGSLDTALALLAERPGELARRLVHLAGRIAVERPDRTETLIETMSAAAPRISPGVLISALGALRAPRQEGQDRAFFTSGRRARIWLSPETRPPLPYSVAEGLWGVLESEIDRRAARLPAVDHAVIDEALADLIAPFAARSASTALADLPRGSSQPLPDGKSLRLFLHWMEQPDQRVDLDLSLSVYDDDWNFLGLCDYTHLRLGDTAGVHSGDLTSAPPPLGASEFVDLDLTALADLGARYLVPVVFSYNNVAFDDLAEGFAGFMVEPSTVAGGSPFDPRAVEQRFDLHGASRVALPLIADLYGEHANGTMRWLDVSAAVSGTDHNLLKHEQKLAKLGASLDALFSSAARLTLWEIACRHAAARTEHITVRRRDGGTQFYRLRENEGRTQFLSRLLTGVSDESAASIDSGPSTVEPVTGLYLLIRADLPVPRGSSVYALYPGDLQPDAYHHLTATDLVSSLEPATT